MSPKAVNFAQVFSSIDLDSLRETVISNRVVPYYHEPRCRLCTAQDRMGGRGQQVRDIVERSLTFGATRASILRHIKPMMADWPRNCRVVKSSIDTHLKYHMSALAREVRSIAESEAHKQGINTVESVGLILTAQAWYKAVAAVGMKSLADGSLQVTKVDEVTKVWQALHELEREEQGDSVIDAMLADWNMVLESLAEVVPQELLVRAAERLVEKKEKKRELPTSSIVETEEDDDGVFEALIGGDSEKV